MLKGNFYSMGSVNGTLEDRFSLFISDRFILNNLNSEMNSRGQIPQDLLLARHSRCDVYCGARETVGESSVSSGCWGEDSNHENEWARHTPTLSRPFAFPGNLHPAKLLLKASHLFGPTPQFIDLLCETLLGHFISVPLVRRSSKVWVN